MNVVIVKHEKSDKHYLFRVPYNQNLIAGDLVLLDTKNGNQIGFCISDSFTTPKDENTAIKLYQAFGLNDKPSARVIGKLTLEDWSKSGDIHLETYYPQFCENYSPTQVENAGVCDITHIRCNPYRCRYPQFHHKSNQQ